MVSIKSIQLDSINNAKRIVLKVGSALIVNPKQVISTNHGLKA